MPLSPGDKLGPYEILAPLGAGGMGEVYKARDTRLDRLVAIKTSRTEFSERFAREARAVAALNHPNICQLYPVPDFPARNYFECTIHSRWQDGGLRFHPKMEASITFIPFSLLPTGAGQARQVTSDSLHHEDAAFLPDGQSMVFVGNPPGRPRMWYAQDLKGGPPRAFGPEGVSFTHLWEPVVLSPDGRNISVVTADKNLLLQPIAGGVGRAIPDLKAGFTPVRWCPGGATIMLQKKEGVAMQNLRNQRNYRDTAPLEVHRSSGRSGRGRGTPSPDRSGLPVRRVGRSGPRIPAVSHEGPGVLKSLEPDHPGRGQ